MPGQPFRCSLLIAPGKTSLAVGREFNVVRRIGIDEVVGLETQLLKVNVAEIPITQPGLILIKVICIRQPGRVRTEWNVECTASVEAAEAVEAGSIQVVKQLRCFAAGLLVDSDEIVEAFSVFVIDRFVIPGLNGYCEATLDLLVEVD